MVKYFRYSGVVLAATLMAAVAFADEAFLTAEGLNFSLKKMQRIQLELEDAEPVAGSDLLFEMGVEADNLAFLLTNEVLSNSMNQKGLIELAMDRTDEMGIYLDWLPGKRRFIYDGEAFRRYLELMPDGVNAAESAFRLIEQDFFRSSGNEAESLLESAARKQEYLQMYADTARMPEVGILLAIDFRDLWRLYRSGGDSDNAKLFSEKTRSQFEWVITTFPDADESDIASGLLQRFEGELVSATESPDQG